MNCHPYHGQRAVLATMHDKLPLVAPALLGLVDLHVRSVEVDTDQFGTFSGDVIRSRTPWDTAVCKARLGMAVSGSTLGLSSEGSFGPLPALPFVTGAVELVVLVDDRRGIIVGETATDYAVATIAADVSPDEDIEGVLRRGAFPEHGMTVRPAEGSTNPIRTGIHDRRTLDRAIRDCALASANGRAHVQTDLRAHHCPTRRPVIERAARRLAERLAACCPSCSAPGWGVIRIDVGVPCRHCGSLVPIPSADVYGCAGCATTHAVQRPHPRLADPGACERCNP